MVSVSLRQKPVPATEQNTLAPACGTVAIATTAAASDSIRPVSGTPAWARNDHAPGAPRPASPWDEWIIPPKPAALVDTSEFTVPEPELSAPDVPAASAAAVARGTAAVRKPRPHPIEPSPAPPAPASSTEMDSSASVLPPDFRPWRVDFTRPDVVEYPEAPRPESSTVTRRLVLLLGLAYLFLAALASGLAYTGYFTTAASTGDDDGGDGYRPEDEPGPAREHRPADPLPRPRPPARDPDAPGLHTRPDGSRYLVMPLPGDIADRFRGHTSATATPVVIGGGAL